MVNRLRLPHMHTGFARGPGESEYPNLWRGLVVAWPFGMIGSGTTVRDFSPSHNNIATLQGPTWTAEGLSFDGSNDYVDTPDHNSVDFGTSDFSIMLRVKTSSTSIQQYMRKQGASASDPGWQFFHRAGSTNLELDFSSGSDLGNPTWADSNFRDGNWHHIAINFDRSSDAILFLDGQSKGGITISGQSGSVNNSENLQISRNNTHFLNGIVDDVYIHNRLLSAGEIRLFSSQLYAPFVPRRRIYGFTVAGAGVSSPIPQFLVGSR